MKSKLIALTALILVLSVALIACTAHADNAESFPSEDGENSVQAPADSAEQPAAEQEPEVESEPEPEEDNVQRVMTDEMIETFFRFCSPNSEFDPDNAWVKEIESYCKSHYYANDEINGYTLCHISRGVGDAALVRRDIDGYRFVQSYIEYPSALQLYLYKDGEFTTIEDAFKQDIVSAAEVYEIVSNDRKYAVMAKPLSEVTEDDPYLFNEIIIVNQAGKDYMDSIGEIPEPRMTADEFCREYYDKSKSETLADIEAELKTIEEDAKFNNIETIYYPKKIELQTTAVMKIEYDENGNPVRFAGIDVEDVYCHGELGSYLSGNTEFITYHIVISNDGDEDAVVEELNANEYVVCAMRERSY